MPFTAVVVNDDGKSKIVDITSLNKPRSNLAGMSITCPECGNPMHVRQSLAVRPHFAHNPGYETRECALAGSGESPEHRETKIAVRDFLREQDIYEECEFVFEFKIGDRRADLAVIASDGFIEVHEIQLSGISSQVLAQRTADYEAEGASVFWWLGEKANKDDNKHWLYGHCGQFGVINTETTFKTKQ